MRSFLPFSRFLSYSVFWIKRILLQHFIPSLNYGIKNYSLKVMKKKKKNTVQCTKKSVKKKNFYTDISLIYLYTVYEEYIYSAKKCYLCRWRTDFCRRWRRDEQRKKTATQPTTTTTDREKCKKTAVTKAEGKFGF